MSHVGFFQDGTLGTHVKSLRSLLSATRPSDAMAMRAAWHDLGDGACFNIECTPKNSKQPRTERTSSSHARARSFYQESSPNAVASVARCGHLLHNRFACEKGEPPNQALEVLGAMQWQCVLLGMILVMGHALTLNAPPRIANNLGQN